jgi:hypothetical protein
LWLKIPQKLEKFIKNCSKLQKTPHFFLKIPKNHLIFQKNPQKSLCKKSSGIYTRMQYTAYEYSGKRPTAIDQRLFLTLDSQRNFPKIKACLWCLPDVALAEAGA